jgi:hypothetical protein
MQIQRCLNANPILIPNLTHTQIQLVLIKKANRVLSLSYLMIKIGKVVHKTKYSSVYVMAPNEVPTT